MVRSNVRPIMVLLVLAASVWGISLAAETSKIEAMKADPGGPLASDETHKNAQSPHPGPLPTGEGTVVASKRNGDTTVINLKYAQAEDMVKQLKEILCGTSGNAEGAIDKYPGMHDPPLGYYASISTINIKVGPHSQNTLIVEGDQENTAMIERLVQILDRKPDVPAVVAIGLDERKLEGKTETNETLENAQSPHPNPLPKGEGTKNAAFPKGEGTGKDEQGRKPEAVSKTDGKVAQEGQKSKPLPKNEKGELRFNFVNTPWKEVIEWFVEQSGYTLSPKGSITTFPPGTLTYIDPNWYAPEKALDVLSILLMKNDHTIVSRDKAMWVVHMADISDDWVLLHPEYLDGKGDFEILGVKFDLGQLAPSEVEPEVRKLLGPQGKIDILPTAKMMQVTDIAQNLRKIRDSIVRLRNPDKKVYRLFELKHIAPREAIAELRPFFDLKESETAAADGSIRLTIAPGGNKLIASGVPEKIARVEKILQIIDVPRGGPDARADLPGVVVYSTDGADPQQVLKILQTLFAGKQDVRFEIDVPNGCIIALAPAAEQKSIAAVLNKRNNDESQKIIKVLPLNGLDAQLATLAIQALFCVSGTTPEENASLSPKFATDSTGTKLYIRATAAQIKMIDELLDQMRGTSSTTKPTEDSKKKTETDQNTSANGSG
jgi:hypothetical protein